MRSFKRTIVCLIFMLCGTSWASSLLLLDTAQGEEYQYQTMISLAQNVGFRTKYKPIAEIMDESLTELTSLQFDAVFFLLSTEFLKKMNESPVAKKVLTLIKQFASRPNKLVGLIFPSGITQGIGPFNPILESLGIQLTRNSIGIIPGETQGPIDQKLVIDFIQHSNEFLSTPITTRGIDYDTMIFRPQQARLKISTKQTFHDKTLHVAMLPLKTDFISPATKKLLPHGIYWRNPIKNNHVFISSIGALNFSSIAEDFRLTPADTNQRLNMLNATQETFWELSKITDEGIDLRNILLREKPNLPQNISLIGKNTSSASKIKCPWMDISIFFDNTHKEEQDKLITYIFESDFTHLWLSIAPNWYYSPIATRTKQDGPYGPEGIKKMVENFSKKLLAKSENSKKPIPKILIGFEIANNLRGKNVPYKNMAYDLYGNTYKDAPAPLNNEFWNEEVIIPLYKFLKDWKTASIIPVSGILLDLEMYVKSTGTFLSTMGFDQETFNLFRKNKVNQIYERTLEMLYPKLVNYQQPTNYLLNSRWTKQYFDFLQSKASDLGNKLRVVFNKLIPGGEIGCYAPNISPSWFYKGFYKGLSKDPIMLLTFNAEFNSHKPWLAKNNINVKHCYALMLSKLQSEKDFAWLNLLKKHDGVWLNRFSTLTEKYISHPEHTPLSQTPGSLKRFLMAISAS